MLESVKRLREWISSLYTPNSAELKLEGLSIADRIDEEAKDNEKFRDEAEPFCDRLREASSERADVTLFGVDYSALPVDADGVPIHVGDWITGKWNAKAKVVAVTSDDVYWWEPDGCKWCHALEVRHYHEPTVKDLLLEACKAYHGLMIEGMSDVAHDMPAPSEIIAEYAAKLRLADDVEEQ